MKPKKQRLHSAELRRLDRITEALERIAIAIENTPTRVEIDHVNNKINVKDGVGVQMGGESNVEYIHPNTAKYENFAPQGIAAKDIDNIDRSTEVDSNNDNTSQVVEGSGSNANHSSVSGEAKHISGVSSAFNTNANDVVKDLTGALHRSTVQRLDQYKET